MTDQSKLERKETDQIISSALAGMGSGLLIENAAQCTDIFKT